MAVGTQTIIAGQRGTYNANVNSQAKRDVEDVVKLLLPTSRPMQNWFMTRSWANEETSGARGKKEWYEDKFLPSTTTTASIAASAAQQTITVANPIWTANDTGIVETTDELFTVISISGSTIDIVPSNGVAFTAISSTTNIQRLSPSFIEGGPKATSTTVVANLKSAYPQIIKKALKLTGTQQATAWYGGQDWKYQWVKKLMELEEEAERTWLNNGASYDGGSASAGRTYSAGFKSLTTNLFGYSDPLDKTEWNAGLKQQFSYTNNTNLVAFAGGEALNDFDNFMTSIWSIQQTEPDMELKGFGLLTTNPQKTKLVTYRHPQGMVDIHYDPQLTGRYAHDVIVIDPMNVKKIYMAADEDGPRKYRKQFGIQTPGDDVKEAQYMMHQGIAIQLEETMSRFYKS